MTVVQTLYVSKHWIFTTAYCAKVLQFGFSILTVAYRDNQSVYRMGGIDSA